MPKKIVYLERDIRDTLVSYYFEKTKRMRKHPYEGTISKFIRDPRFGAASILDHRRGWGNAPAETILHISYEGLKEDTMGVLSGLLKLLGHKTSRNTIKEAVNFAEFEKMRKMEKSGTSLISGYRGRFGRGHKRGDKESFRCRKGKVGGYKDYLSEEDLQYIKSVEEMYR